MIIYLPTSRGVFKGIVRYYIDNNLTYRIGIKSSSKYAAHYPDVDTLIRNPPGHFYTEKNDNYGQWVKIWLKKSQYINLEGFSIICDFYSECPKHWHFSVSQDNRKWTILHTSSTEVPISGAIFNTFANHVKFFKWTLTGPNNYNKNFMNIRGLDVYGKLFTASTYQIKRGISTSILLFIIINKS